MKFANIVGSILSAIPSVLGAIHPIEVRGRHFFDSITKQPVCDFMFIPTTKKNSTNNLFHLVFP